jgi:hypothetical protein
MIRQVKLQVRAPIITNDPACRRNNGPYARAIRWLGKRWLIAEPVRRAKTR